MKKIIIILFVLTILLVGKNDTKEILIPDKAIRFRIVANSNSIEDQQEKMIIKEKLEKEIYELINKEKTENIENTLQNNMDKIKEIISSYNVSYDINYGLNYFPVKHYKGVLYPAGNYESLVITLGEGLGDNFWCVLFPPLCLLDNEVQDTSEVEYQLYVKKLLDKF